MHRLIWGIRTVSYVVAFFIFPKKTKLLLAVSDLLAETHAFQNAVAIVDKNSQAKQLMENNYHGYHPSIESLLELPSNTLGYRYARHLKDNQIGMYRRNNNQRKTNGAYIIERNREIHDILHAVFGFGISIPQEIGINLILATQCFNPMSVGIIGGGILRTLFLSPQELPEVFENIKRGWELARQSEFVLGIPWEEMWHVDLNEVRRQIGISGYFKDFSNSVTSEVLFSPQVYEWPFS
jgi:ubiquinone biosynthesis protein COQ4